MSDAVLLNTKQVASFVARGMLRFDGIIPDETNRAFEAMAEQNSVPVVPAGVPLDDAYEPGSPPHALVNHPLVRGAIESLVGAGSRFDHHFLHIAMPPSFFEKRGLRQSSQHTHQDSTIDPRRAFDIQIMYFPREVTREMGGTRYLPGSHLRIVSEAAVGRYQNIAGQQHVVCPAGSVMVLHHGVWHGGGINRSERARYMFKIRLNPTVRQCRLWDTSDLGPELLEQRPIFWLRELPDPEHIHSILTAQEPWYEMDTGRLEILNRVRLWRHLIGDEEADVDYWMTRVENEPGT